MTESNEALQLREARMHSDCSTALRALQAARIARCPCRDAVTGRRPKSDVRCRFFTSKNKANFDNRLISFSDFSNKNMGNLLMPPWD
jgi:hypothetical protein